MQFKTWLESKAMQLPEELIKQIEDSLPQIIEKVKEMRERAEKDETTWNDKFGIPVLSLTYDDPYPQPFKMRGVEIDPPDFLWQWQKSRTIPIFVKYNTKETTLGQFHHDYGPRIVVNAYNVEPTKRDVRHVLVHEFIHSIDPKIKKDITKQTTGKEIESKEERYRRYIRKPQEIDAFASTIAYNITQSAKALKGTEWENKIQQMLQDTLNYLRTPTQKHAGFFAYHKHWNDLSALKKHIKPKDWKRVRVIIYNAVQDAMKTLQPN